MNASPSMFSTGNGPNTLESAELPRLSPITKTPLGHLGRLVGAGEGQVLVQVWLFLLLPVHQEGAVAHLDLVPRHPHHALDELLVVPSPTLSKTTTSPRSGSVRR